MVDNNTRWWYRSLDSDQAIGPLEKHSMIALIKEGTVDKSCLVRQDEQESWSVITEHQEFSAFFKSVLDAPTASPSHRFFARIFDVWFLSVICVLPASFIQSLYSASWVNFMDAPAADKAATIIFLPFILLIEALIAAMFGNTLGKWLMGIKVLDYRGESLTFGRYLSRNFRIWWSGLAIGFPLFSLATMYYQWNRLSSERSTSYDAALNTQVRLYSPSLGKKVAFFVLAIGLFFFMGWLQVLSSEYDRDRWKVLSKEDATWTNPISGESVQIPAYWTINESADVNGNPIYSFGGLSDRAVLIFAHESGPGFSLERYAKAIRNASSKHFILDGEETFSLVNNIPTWVALGRSREDQSVDVRVEVRKYGNDFWRMYIIQTPPKGVTDKQVELLKLQLLSTVKQTIS